jgi:hypothetical protein
VAGGALGLAGSKIVTEKIINPIIDYGTELADKWVIQPIDHLLVTVKFAKPKPIIQEKIEPPSRG